MLRIKVDVDFFNTGLSGCQLICARTRASYVSNSCKSALGAGHRYGVNNALQGPLCLVRLQGSGSTKCFSNISGFQSPWQRSVAYAWLACCLRQTAVFSLLRKVHLRYCIACREVQLGIPHGNADRRVNDARKIPSQKASLPGTTDQRADLAFCGDLANHAVDRIRDVQSALGIHCEAGCAAVFSIERAKVLPDVNPAS